MNRKCTKQFAALPYRIDSARPQVMLITSRQTGRWIIPKGWPIKGRAPRAVAAHEAYEEAGLRGKIQKRPLGTYRYEKRLTLERAVTCEVSVFLLKVEQQLDDWPEKRDRVRCWLNSDEAAARVEEPELRALLANLAGLLDVSEPVPKRPAFSAPVICR